MKCIIKEIRDPTQHEARHFVDTTLTGSGLSGIFCGRDRPGKWKIRWTKLEEGRKEERGGKCRKDTITVCTASEVWARATVSCCKAGMILRLKLQVNYIHLCPDVNSNID